MEDRTRTEGKRDVWDRLGEAIQAMARVGRFLVREGNRRQLALRRRDGEVLVRLPLTIAVVIALFLLWLAWPLLLLTLIVVVAMRGSVVILRREPQQG